MSDPQWTSLLPPVLAIVLAVSTRRVVPSLFGGIWLGYGFLLANSTGSLNPFPALAAAINGSIAVLGGAGDARVIVFILVIGAMIGLMEHSGGVRAFVAMLTTRRWVDTPEKAQWLAWGTGLVIFIESTITLLVAGAVARPLFDRFSLSRERLAYLIDATSAPVCMLIPLNAWGALNIGLLSGVGIDDALGVFVAAVPLNFYALAAVALAALSIRFDIVIGPMRAAEARAAGGEPSRAGSTRPPETAPASEAIPVDAPGLSLPDGAGARQMIVPILALVATVPVGLWITGEGDFLAGSGSISVLWATLAGTAAAWMLAARAGVKSDELSAVALRGAGSMLPVAVLLLLALALGDVASELGTGPYLSKLVSAAFPMALLPGIVFLVAAVTAFSIGTSFGTFALLVPLAMALAEQLGLSQPLLLAAVLSGGVFGDHASPISDTTVVASLAAATDHIDHVRTQLPYALVAGGAAFVGFLLAGLLL